MSPAALESALRRRGMGFRELQRLVHPTHFSISPSRAWLGLSRAVVTLALGQACLLASPAQPVLAVALTVVGWIVSSTGLAGFFIVGHECGHGAFSRTPWVNTLVGHLCMSPILIGFHNWRRAHAHHHAHTQMRGEDTDWPEQMPTRAAYDAGSPGDRWRARLAYGSFVGTLLGFPVAMVRRTFMRALYPQVKLSRRARRELALSNALMVLASGGVIGGLWHACGFGGMIRHYGIPMYLGMVLGTLFTYLHHSAPGARAYARHAWNPITAASSAACSGQPVMPYSVASSPASASSAKRDAARLSCPSASAGLKAGSALNRSSRPAMSRSSCVSRSRNARPARP